MSNGTDQPPEDIECLRRAARAYGLVAYRAWVRAGDEVTAERVAGEMQALGLLGQGGSPAQWMDDAAPQAAVAGAGEDALGALVFDWGEAYRIGRDAARGWWASRRDQVGGLLTAATADELRQVIRADYNVRPVPRSAPAGGPGPAGEVRGRA
jgi:hypothetical protein